MQQNNIHAIISLYLFSCLFSVCLLAQETVTENTNVNTDYRLNIRKAVEKITLDGLLEEADWQTADTAKDFAQSYPDDKGLAKSKTVVHVTYDDKYLYIAAICYDELEGNYVVQSLKRDFSFPVNDAFGVFIDPFNNQTTGFSFAVSPKGAQREGLVQNGGQFGVTTSWDNRWFSKVTNYPDRWQVEIAIPFKTLRYKSNIQEWRINFARNDLKRIETSTWSPVPTQYNVASLAFTGILAWDAPPKKAGANVSIIPYLTTGINQDLTDDENNKVRGDFNTGFDAKIAVTPSLNLDITVNPDFSQVEVDRQVTNLDRFSIFFPERRDFFLENSDLFNFGVRPVRPFFSRRIGLDSGELVPILLGARLTGNLNKDLRIGLMSIQTEGSPDGRQSQNFSVAMLQHRVLKRSSISAFVVNRQAFDGYKLDKDDYNTVIGSEFAYRSASNKWRGSLLYHQTFAQHDTETFSNKLHERASLISTIGYEDRHVFGFFSLEYVGRDYVADVGFVPELFQRDDELGTSQAVPYLASLHWLGYKWYPEKSKAIRFWGIEYSGKVFLTNEEQTLWDRWSRIKFFLYLNNNSIARLNLRNTQTQLFFPTNITGEMDSLLQAGTYHYNDIGVEYEATKRNKLYGSLRAYYGEFYNGTRLNLSLDATYRVQPWGNFSLNFSYNDIRFPEGFGNSKLFLIGPRLEFTFSKSVFLTTFLQYNTQSDNFNINSRLQWRFAPMSDVFLVFTDNLDTNNFGQKNWGLVLKANYWLSL